MTGGRAAAPERLYQSLRNVSRKQEYSIGSSLLSGLSLPQHLVAQFICFRTHFR